MGNITELSNKSKLLFDKKYTKDMFYEEFGRPINNILFDQRGIEFKILLDEFIKLSPRNILEIGSMYGGSLWYWLKYSRPDATVVSIDINREFLCDEIRKSKYAPKLIEINSDSTNPETLIRVNNICKSFDFIFLDANHSYEFVSKDVCNFLPLVKNGIFAMHDINYNPSYDGCNIVWNKIKTQYKSFEIIDKNIPWWACYGTGIIYKE